jgi:hypothetical protein
VVVELVDRELVDRLQPEAGGVVDDHVQAAAVREHALHELGRRLGVGEVG